MVDMTTTDRINADGYDTDGLYVSIDGMDDPIERHLELGEYFPNPVELEQHILKGRVDDIHLDRLLGDLRPALLSAGLGVPGGTAAAIRILNRIADARGPIDLLPTGGHLDPALLEAFVEKIQDPAQIAAWLVEHDTIAYDLITVHGAERAIFYQLFEGLWSKSHEASVDSFIRARLRRRIPQVLADLGGHEENLRDLNIEIVALTAVDEEGKTGKEITQERKEKKDLAAVLLLMESRKIIFDARRCLKGVNGVFGSAYILKVRQELRGIKDLNVDEDALDAQPYVVLTPNFAFDMADLDRTRPRAKAAPLYLTRATRINPILVRTYFEQDVAWAPEYLLRGIDNCHEILMEHAPNFYKLLAYQFDSDTDKEIALSTLYERLECFQRVLGYCILGDQKAKISIAIQGTANSGKSTLTRILSHVFGDYAGAVNASVIMPTRAAGGRADPTVLGELYGKRLAFISEINSKVDVPTYLAVTGGDDIVIRNLYEAAHTWKCETKLWMVGNLSPIFDSTPAVQTRARLIPWDKTVPECARDLSLEDGAIEEAPEILTWVLQGAYKYLEDRDKPGGVLEALGFPKDWLDAAEQNITESDPLHTFFAVFHPSDEYKIKADALYKHYRNWCEIEGLHGQDVWSQNKFSRALKVRAIRKVFNGGAAFYYLEHETASELGKALAEMAGVTS